MGKGKRVQFAGANNPLYIIRKGIGEQHVETRCIASLRNPDANPLKPFKKSPDGIEVKPDKMAVGYEPDAAGEFITTEVEVEKGDMLYLFSDGYADQFGGPKGKKFRYGPFKQLLEEIHQKPMEEQKDVLDKELEDWKGKQEQVDDVVVIGLRL